MLLHPDPHKTLISSHSFCHRTTIVAATRVDYVRFLSNTRELQQGVKNDPAVTLTEQQRLALYIHKDKSTRTPAPIPNRAPENVVLETIGLQNKISTFEPTSQEENHRGMPDDAVAIGYKNQIQADDNARSACNKLGLGKCSIEDRFRGPGCIALAKSADGDGSWGASFGEGQGRLSEAKSEALSACSDAGQTCFIEKYECTDR
ncbi:DUF4189 domain-containing protein [Candidatus Spongiihabitans sp.]|uniref:DUF4189 domain-containing protein n=1 Tax=Candidatus Spongiihabitans sp. TaxID=3101308 RepID=UPI003C70357F